MDKAWGILFLAAAVFSIAIFAYAPSQGWWFPEDVSTHGHEIDKLFYVILAVTGLAFVATQAVLCFVVFRYSGLRRGEKGTFIHTIHWLEYLWTFVTAAVLAWIAFVQVDAWANIKFKTRAPDVKTHAHVMAGQFEWRITYPGFDGEFNTVDDVMGLNQLHIPVESPILVDLESRDVLHSFFLPNFRIKQDAVPGMVIPVWFTTKPGTEDSYEIVCAELCGWGHYKMKGMVFVHPKETVDLEALKAEVAELKEQLDGFAADAAEKPDKKKRLEVERAWTKQLGRLGRFTENPGLHLSFEDWLKKAHEEANAVALED